MTPTEQKAFEQMREALEAIISAHPVSTSLRQTDAVIAARQALTAANAVSHAKPETTTAPEGVAITSESAANAVQPDFSDQATIAGLEASIGHLSALVNEQLLLLEEVNENLGVDGLGAELDDDQSPTISKVRAHLAAMAPPKRPAVQPQPMAYAVFCSNGNIRIWGHSPDDVKRIKAEFGSSLIALYAHPQATEPAGYKLVPVEPTQEMLDAVVTTVDDHLLGPDAEKQYREDWAAMLAAAPEAP